MLRIDKSSNWKSFALFLCFRTWSKDEISLTDPRKRSICTISSPRVILPEDPPVNWKLCTNLVCIVLISVCRHDKGFKWQLKMK